MTHHIIKSLAAVALGAMLLTGSVVAQNGYHQVGDTVRGKCPIYQYEQGWWPTLNASGHTDSLINTAFSTFGYMKHTTNTPLKVIGIASTWARLDRTTMQEDLDTSIDGTLYYVLLDATAGGPVELARVCWTDDYTTHPTRYMELPLKTGLCSNMEDHDTIVSLREYYFDSAITVTDSFYLGCVVPDIDASGPNGFAIFSYIASHMWNYCTYSSMDANGTYKECAMEMPEFTYYDSSRLDNQWHYYTHKRFQLIFPIIELDTFCVTPEEPQVVYRDSLTVRVEWVDNNNLYWEVSRTALNGDPDTGLITPTTVPYIEYTDINDDSIYHVYVRGYCETGIWSGWSDWSTHCLIDSIPTPPTPPEGINTIEATDFTLSPNPAKSLVTLKCTRDMQGSVEIIDMQGKVWSKKVLAGHLTEFDVSALPAGAYLVRITTDKGTTTKKLSIE
ncbi:MAG: T9SS type A sorting domain-containing protein [Bacteroidales bacterium]|nr:T9SS type A sorting domain-containing protein [Bacteroidales bacterium]